MEAEPSGDGDFKTKPTPAPPSPVPPSGIRVIESDKGRFVAMPRTLQENGETQYSDTFRAITADETLWWTPSMTPMSRNCRSRWSRKACA